MGLVTTKEVLEDGYRNHYAIGAFAAHNLEIVKAIVSAAEAMQTPVIIQTTPGTIRYIGINHVYAMVKTAAEESKVPVALHLDHGDSFETVVQCLRSGYTSVMIDASDLPFEENVNYVKKVVETAHAVGVPVEAELGTIGGAEEDLERDEAEARLTDPKAAKDFVDRTQIDSLAPAFGTAHGHYKNEPVLDLDRLEEISNRVHLPLVMHGASGVPDEGVRRAIQRGVSKVNFSTELKTAFAEELRRFLNEYPNEADPRKYFVSAREKVEEIVKHKMDILLSSKTTR